MFVICDKLITDSSIWENLARIKAVKIEWKNAHLSRVCLSELWTNGNYKNIIKYKIACIHFFLYCRMLIIVTLSTERKCEQYPNFKDNGNAHVCTSKRNSYTQLNVYALCYVKAISHTIRTNIDIAYFHTNNTSVLLYTVVTKTQK